MNYRILYFVVLFRLETIWIGLEKLFLLCFRMKHLEFHSLFSNHQSYFQLGIHSPIFQTYGFLPLKFWGFLCDWPWHMEWYESLIFNLSSFANLCLVFILIIILTFVDGMSSFLPVTCGIAQSFNFYLYYSYFLLTTSLTTLLTILIFMRVN